LLGHRGARASRHVPENTLASFELCLAHGCDGFEFDVRQSSDGVAVVCHDPVSAGLPIARTPAHVLDLPTLDSILGQFSSRAFLDIELKVCGLESQVVEALRAQVPQEEYVVSSFLVEALRTVHQLDPAIPLGFLFDRHHQACPEDISITWLIPHFKLVSPGLVEQVHAQGKKIMVWTVNDAGQMRMFAEWGVDSIISDDPQLLVRSVGEAH